MTTGVYQITCTPTGKRYIGSSCDIEGRWKDHQCELDQNKHCNPHLQNAWNKRSEKAFRFEVLEKCKNGQEKIREQYYLDNSKPEFNILSNACGLSQGHVFSPETKVKMSVARKGKSSPMKGKKHTPEARAKLSAARKGKTPWNKGETYTSETRAKMSKAAKGQTPWNKGKKRTPETCAKISVANKGKTPWNKGKKFTPEHRKKLSEAAKRRWVKQNKSDGR